MKVDVVTKNSVHRNDRCRHCLNTYKVGEAIAWCRTDAFAKPRFSIHISCMEVLVAKAPNTFAETRQRIIDTGSVWA